MSIHPTFTMILIPIVEINITVQQAAKWHQSSSRWNCYHYSQLTPYCTRYFYLLLSPQYAACMVTQPLNGLQYGSALKRRVKSAGDDIPDAYSRN